MNDTTESPLAIAIGFGLYALLAWIICPVIAICLFMQHFSWPTWVDVVVGMFAGGFVGYIAAVLIAAPFAYWLDRKRR